ncbi:MAG: tRNA (adenosine(37)-N6)-threonylcarbamoyltransferase complex transferase subunit TsaD [Lentisphaeraceae bacterium]|nr:tRNA (adenosine(37)-N6)-threonylcarbamoyltransferase complex transferase subunit TsaD [Lentisphaeraceae bacterium]
MLVLGIESSCDETAIALVRDGHEVLASAISSQIAKHAEYGGVVPELAAREHLANVRQVMDEALEEAGCALEDIDGIAVTNPPGLLPALLVGTSFASGLAASLEIPLIGVNHLIAHIYAAFIERQDLLKTGDKPVTALLVSGGHTQIIIMHRDGRCEIVGTTIDDAAGEAFDKGGKILGLPYPGGPVIDRLAKGGNVKAIQFPRPLKGKKEHRFNFSFSGLKTSLLYKVKGKEVSDDELKDVLASYQEAIVDVLSHKAFDAAKHYGCDTLVVCGGVACNSALRARLTEKGAKSNIEVVLTPPKYCTDNAAMIAGLGYHQLLKGENEVVLEAIPRAPQISQVPFLG